MVAATGLTAVVCALTSFYLTPIYRSKVLLAPIAEQAGSMRSASLLGPYAELLSMAGGADLGGDRKKEALALLRAQRITMDFIAEQDVLPVLFQSRWDSATGRWKPGRAPTLADAFHLFDGKVRSVSEDKRTGLITLTVDWKDRELSAKWAMDFVAYVDRRMRERAIHEAKKNVDYLNAELAKTSVVELRQVVYRLIESQIQTSMLANVSDYYAFRVIDPAVTPDDGAFVRPKRALLTLFGAAIGAFFAVIYSIAAYKLDERS